MSQIRAAAVYARISRDATGAGLGVERQLAACNKLAKERGWVVAEEYVDNDISAFKGKRRPAYQRMLEDIAEGRRDAVIVWHTDRLHREPIELEQFTAVCRRAGVDALKTVNQDIDLGNGDGMLIARIQGAVAAQESQRKSERLKAKALQTALAGRPNGGNLRPFGYEKNQVTVIESEAVVLRELASRCLAGESLISMARWLQSQGVRTVTGGPWRTGSIRQTLTNPRIAGLRAHNGQVVAKAVWPAIITEGEHKQLVAVFERRKVSARRSPRRYLLSGMLRCGKCGNKLFSSARDDVRRYVCSSSPDHGGCGKLTVVAAPVEEWLTAAVLLRLDTPQMRDALSGRAAQDERHAALIAKRQDHFAKKAELRDLWLNDRISADEWIPARDEIEARIRATDRELLKISDGHALDGLVGQGGALGEQWASLNLTRQAAIVAAVLDFATILPGTGGGRREVDPNRIVPTWRL